MNRRFHRAEITPPTDRYLQTPLCQQEQVNSGSGNAPVHTAGDVKADFWALLREYLRDAARTVRRPHVLPVKQERIRSYSKGVQGFHDRVTDGVNL